MVMSSAEAGATIAARCPSDAVTVSTMTALRAFQPYSPSQFNLSCVPMMGGGSALGLGVALARPDQLVVVLDGDGSLLMQLGSLATVAGAAPRRYVHFVFDNGVWFEGGANLPIPAAGRLDWTKLAIGAGYRHAFHCADVTELEARLEHVFSDDGPALVALAVAAEAADRSPWSRDSPQTETPDAQFTRMGDEARAVRDRLIGGGR